MTTLAGPPPRQDIRPKPLRTATLAVALCLAFVLLGVWLILSGRSERAVLVGVLSVMFFGGGIVLLLVALVADHFRPRLRLVLTREGIEQHTRHGVSCLPWADIEEIGRGTGGVGVLLRSYDRYLASLSPEMLADHKRSLPRRKLAMRATVQAIAALRVLRRTTPADAWVEVFAPGPSTAPLTTFEQVRKVEDLLRWSRDADGYDVLLPWNVLDRPTGQFVDFLLAYQQHALQSRAADAQPAPRPPDAAQRPERDVVPEGDGAHPAMGSRTPPLAAPRNHPTGLAAHKGTAALHDAECGTAVRQ